ncbi:MAG TPA: glycosyltransferase family 39 protein [bacterium]|jgi:hypothetical protein|nr:glycosyltransferase family 39 protein [bacterium]
MIVVTEFLSYIVLSLLIAKLSTLAVYSISVITIGCALSYALLWWPQNKVRLVAGSDHIQLYRLILGAALSYWGAHLWTGTDPIWFQGGFFECMAFFVFVSAFPQNPESSTVSKPSKNKKVLSVKTKPMKTKAKTSSKQPAALGLGAKLLIVLVALGFLMEFSFFKEHVGWALVFAAGVVAVTVWIKLIKKEGPAETLKVNENYVVWGLVGLSALMRFPFIWNHLTGFQIDEANDLQGAQDFLRNAVRSPFTTGWSGRATYPFAVQSDIFKIFGQHLFAARALSVVFAVLGIYLFYKLSRYFFSVTASAVGTLLLSVSWWFMWGSYIVICMMMQDLGVIAAFYFAEKGLREGKRIFFFWSGAVTAITVMTYVWGRTAPILLLAWLVVSFLITENAENLRKNRLWGALCWLGGFLWVLGPFIGWLTINQEFYGRIKELSMMSLVAKTHDYMLPVKTFAFTLLSPYISYNIDERFALANRPLFDDVSSLLLLVGIVLALMALRRRSSWILLLGLGACIPANALAIQNATPEPSYLNGLRFFCIVPFVYWSVTYAIEMILGWVRQESANFQKKATIFLCVVLAGTVLYNAKWIYYDFHKTGHWSRLGFNHILIADLVRDEAKTHEVYLCAEYCGSSVVQFLDGDIKFKPAEDSLRLPLPSKPTQDVAFVLRAWNYAEPLKDDIMKKCPHTVIKTIPDSDGNPYLWTLEVPLSDFK